MFSLTDLNNYSNQSVTYQDDRPFTLTTSGGTNQNITVMEPTSGDDRYTLPCDLVITDLYSIEPTTNITYTITTPASVADVIFGDIGNMILDVNAGVYTISNIRSSAEFELIKSPTIVGVIGDETDYVINVSFNDGINAPITWNVNVTTTDIPNPVLTSAVIGISNPNPRPSPLESYTDTAYIHYDRPIQTTGVGNIYLRRNGVTVHTYNSIDVLVNNTMMTFTVILDTFGIYTIDIDSGFVESSDGTHQYAAVYINPVLTFETILGSDRPNINLWSGAWDLYNNVYPGFEIETVTGQGNFGYAGRWRKETINMINYNSRLEHGGPGGVIDIGTGDYTIEFWGKGHPAGNRYTVVLGEFIKAEWLMDSEWYHIAYVRQNGYIKTFINGVYQNSSHTLWENSVQGGCGYLGSIPCSSPLISFTGQGLYGYMEELRISNRCVYWEDFTPPMQRFHPLSGSDLLLVHFDEYGVVDQPLAARQDYFEIVSVTQDPNDYTLIVEFLNPVHMGTFGPGDQVTVCCTDNPQWETLNPALDEVKLLDPIDDGTNILKFPSDYGHQSPPWFIDAGYTYTLTCNKWTLEHPDDPIYNTQWPVTKTFTI